MAYGVRLARLASLGSGDEVGLHRCGSRTTGGFQRAPNVSTAGNQTTASWPSRHPGSEATGPRAYTGTTLTRAGDVRFEHDALGRVALRQKTRLSRKPDTWRYTWDTENRLTSVTTPDGTRWRYRYDPLGRRSAKQRLAADGESVVEEVRFTWDGLTLCEQTSHHPDVPNTVALTWDHRADVPLAQTERILAADDRQEQIDRRFFAIATDLVGTPTELIDQSGDIAWRTRSTLWGTTAWGRDSSTYTPLRFPGQYYDAETGLHYNYFRHYDPETGRYTSPDPLGLAPAPNPVAYVDNPHSGCDPLGLMPKYTKEEKAQQAREKAIQTADDVVERAQGDRMRKAGNYHADSMHGFSDERVLEILKNPDAVYHSTAGSGRLTFRQGEDIVVAEGGGAGAGNVITAYGPSGVRGDSGVRALGGLPTDPGGPITHADVVKGAGFRPRTATWLPLCRFDKAAFTMRLTLDDDWAATVTDDPLRSTPRFDFPGQCVRIAEYADVTEWQRFLVQTFGSREWLWDAPDELRFDQAGRELVGAGFRLPYEAADAEDSARVPAAPPVHPGGLRADAARDFRLEVTTELCRAPGDAVLTCLRDLDVLDEPLEARIGIAPDVALLVQHGTVVGWSLTDPARYLTTGFAAPDPAPPAPTTRLLLTECLDLITTPLLDEVRRRDPAALARLRELDHSLRSQREDRHRADALLSLIGNLVEDYADRPTGQQP